MTFDVISSERFLFCLQYYSSSFLNSDIFVKIAGSYLRRLAAIRASQRYLTNFISSASSGLSSEIKSVECVFRNGRKALRLCALHFSHSLGLTISRPLSGPELQKTFYSLCVFRMKDSGALLDKRHSLRPHNLHALLFFI